MNRVPTVDECNGYAAKIYNGLKSTDGFYDKVNHPPADLADDARHFYGQDLIDRVKVDEKKLWVTAYAIVVSY